MRKDVEGTDMQFHEDSSKTSIVRFLHDSSAQRGGKHDCKRANASALGVMRKKKNKIHTCTCNGRLDFLMKNKKNV